MNSGLSTYACPTHPNVHRLGPGLCPKCGIDLVERVSQADQVREIAKRFIVIGVLVVLALAILTTAAALLK
jgi:hypothetical protein